MITSRFLLFLPLGVERDWYDYAHLAVGGVAALAAIVALIVARRSAEDSKRSADSSEASAAASRNLAKLAEEDLSLARREFEHAEKERSRRPAFEVTLGNWPARRLGTHIVEVGVRNVGDKPASQALITFMVPEDVVLQNCRDRLGYEKSPILGPVLPTREAPVEGDLPCDWIYTSWYRDLPVGVSELALFAILVRPIGTKELMVKAKVAHAESEGRGVASVESFVVKGF